MYACMHECNVCMVWFGMVWCGMVWYVCDLNMNMFIPFEPGVSTRQNPPLQMRQFAYRIDISCAVVRTCRQICNGYIMIFLQGHQVKYSNSNILTFVLGQMFFSFFFKIGY